MHVIKKNVIFWCVISFSLITIQPSGGFQFGTGKNYSLLKEALSAVRHSNNFIPFTDFVNGYDSKLHSASMAYFNEHPALVEQIQSDLETTTVTWNLKQLSHRLLLVPEERKDVAALFTDYCHEIIGALLEETGLINPYESISAVHNDISFAGENMGIKAYIVQDIAKEYTACYQFRGRTDKKIEVNLSGRIPVNEVGSYASYLEYSEKKNCWEFVPNHFTLWKSVSDNPYTVLMTPLEETLHIALRRYTEKVILDLVNQEEAPLSPEKVQKVVDDWIQVEEAIVGGIVYHLVPDVLMKRIPGISAEWIRADIETKSRFEKYHLLQKGIDVVDAEGIRASINLYAQDPHLFRMMLINEKNIKND